MGRHKTVMVKPGTLFGAWEVIGEGSLLELPSGKSQRRIRCLCTSCGVTISDVLLTNLRSGRSRCCADCAPIFSAAGNAKRYLEQMPDFLLEEVAKSIVSECRRRAAMAD